MIKADRPEDSGIVEACIQRDVTAWAELISRYSLLISTAISNRLKKYGFKALREEVEDIRQNVLSSIWEYRKLEKVRNRKSIAYWLAIVSGNMAIEYMRRKKASGDMDLIPIPDEDDPEGPVLEQAAAGDDPDRADKLEMSDLVERAVDSLPEKDRLIMKMHLLNNMRYKEISEVLHVPTGTISSRINRSKAMLKLMLNKYV